MVRDESPIHMTKEAYQRLKERLTTLKNSLPEQIITTKAAADLGDRSENAEYQLSKSRLRGTHRQILMIENQLKRAAIIQVKGKMGGIELGSTVVLRTNDKLSITNNLRQTTDDQATNDLRQKSLTKLQSTGKTLTFQILGAFETNPSKGIISNQSPLGQALIGRKIGDEVTIKIPPNGAGAKTGEQKYTIVEIR